MNHYNYLIVGGGMTADAAVTGIRAVDPTGTIGLIGAEPDAPYDRPPLTKALWKDRAVESIGRKTADKRVTLHLGRTVRTIDAKTRRVEDDAGNGYTGEKLLIATGGRPRRLGLGGDEEVIYFRTLNDYRRLRALTGKDRCFAVIGGGFIGSELAAALTMNGQKVTMIFPGPAIGGHVFPSELAGFLTRYYQEKGVEILAGAKVSRVEARGGAFAVTTTDRQEVVADGLVAGLGIQPNVELAEAAGLRVKDGIVVDEFLRTSAPDIYAAGDVAAFENPALGKRLRVEHEDNANTMGEAAGRSMAGRPEPYRHLPFFYSDLFEFGYEAVGEVDARRETFIDWKRPNEEGVIYYLDGGRVRGVLLWNIFGEVDAARALIAEPGPFTPADLKGRLAAK
jgi:NADPH-dependent 2,4-dienoyl-CoA reductase/sulfur reductase-like enzyme